MEVTTLAPYAKSYEFRASWPERLHPVVWTESGKK